MNWWTTVQCGGDPLVSAFPSRRNDRPPVTLCRASVTNRYATRQPAPNPINWDSQLFFSGRALLRMEGEDVFGSKISLSEYSRSISYRSHVPNSVDDSPPREMIEAPRQRHFSPFPPPPNPALVAPPRLLDFRSSRSRCNDKEHLPASLQLSQATDLTVTMNNFILFVHFEVGFATGFLLPTCHFLWKQHPFESILLYVMLRLIEIETDFRVFLNVRSEVGLQRNSNCTRLNIISSTLNYLSIQEEMEGPIWRDSFAVFDAVIRLTEFSIELFFL